MLAAYSHLSTITDFVTVMAIVGGVVDRGLAETDVGQGDHLTRGVGQGGTR